MHPGSFCRGRRKAPAADSGILGAPTRTSQLASPPGGPWQCIPWRPSIRTAETPLERHPLVNRGSRSVPRRRGTGIRLPLPAQRRRPRALHQRGERGRGLPSDSLALGLVPSVPRVRGGRKLPTLLQMASTSSNTRGKPAPATIHVAIVENHTPSSISRCTRRCLSMPRRSRSPPVDLHITEPANAQTYRAAGTLVSSLAGNANNVGRITLWAFSGIAHDSGFLCLSQGPCSASRPSVNVSLEHIETVHARVGVYTVD